MGQAHQRVKPGGLVKVVGVLHVAGAQAALQVQRGVRACAGCAGVRVAGKGYDGTNIRGAWGTADTAGMSLHCIRPPSTLTLMR